MAIDNERPTLFVTGGSGFVGTRVLRQLATGEARDVRVLVRDPARVRSVLPVESPWQVIAGTLDAPATWQDALRGVDTVLHLASSTGKVSAAVHEAVIVRGTATLIEAAKRAGVRRLLFVSSVAAGFADQRNYPYALAKRRAELLVQGSGLETLIVRPTLVFGPASAVFEGLRKMALLPLPMVFGNGSTRVQPIHVDDLTSLLIAALAPSCRWHGETITVGGPDVVTIEELLRRIRALSVPGNKAAIHIPMEPLRSVLALLEPFMLPMLPFTAGQLSTFINAGSVDDSSPFLAALHQSLEAPMHGLDRMLAASRDV